MGFPQERPEQGSQFFVQIFLIELAKSQPATGFLAGCSVPGHEKHAEKPRRLTGCNLLLRQRLNSRRFIGWVSFVGSKTNWAFFFDPAQLG